VIVMAGGLLVADEATAQATGRCSPSTEQEWQQVRIERDVPPNRSRAEIEQILLGQARLQAVQQAVGITVSGSTTRSQYESMTNCASKEYRDIFFELYSLDVAGLIVDERHVTSPRGLDTLSLVYEARVGCERGPEAAGFTAEVTTNQLTYRESDSITIRATTSAAARIYLFSIAQDGTARLIFPNHVDANNALEAGGSHLVPRSGAAYRFTAELDPKFGPAQSEMLMGIFFLGGGPELFQRSDAFTRTFSLQEINRVLLRVPRGERRRVFTGYEIRGRAAP